MSNVLIPAVFLSQQKPKKAEKERGKKTKKRHLRMKVVSEEESSDSARYGGKVFTPQTVRDIFPPQHRCDVFHPDYRGGVNRGGLFLPKKRRLSSHLTANDNVFPSLSSVRMSSIVSTVFPV